MSANSQLHRANRNNKTSKKWNVASFYNLHTGPHWANTSHKCLAPVVTNSDFPSLCKCFAAQNVFQSLLLAIWISSTFCLCVSPSNNRISQDRKGTCTVRIFPCSPKEAISFLFWGNTWDVSFSCNRNTTFYSLTWEKIKLSFCC